MQKYQKSDAEQEMAHEIGLYGIIYSITEPLSHHSIRMEWHQAMNHVLLYFCTSFDSLCEFFHSISGEIRAASSSWSVV